MNTSNLSSKDRESLLRLVRGRKKLARTLVSERSAKLEVLMTLPEMSEVEALVPTTLPYRYMGGEL